MQLSLINTPLFCSQLLFFSWLQNHLLPCPFKFLTGIDCPGCGFQRAVIALIHGNFTKSFALYPPAIPLLLFFIYGALDSYFKLDNQKSLVKKTLFIIVGTMVMVSYGVKMWVIYTHYKASASAAAVMWL